VACPVTCECPVARPKLGSTCVRVPNACALDVELLLAVAALFEAFDESPQDWPGRHLRKAEVKSGAGSYMVVGAGPQEAYASANTEVARALTQGDGHRAMHIGLSR